MRRLAGERFASVYARPMRGSQVVVTLGLLAAADRRRVAFAIAGYVGPKSAYERHQEIGEVAISGTISCPGPVEPVAQRLPAASS